MVRAALLALIPAPAEACRLALVLAMDVSSSVDAREDELQRLGLALSLLNADVQSAFLANPDPVAVAVFEWSGRFNQSLMLDWTLVRSEADIAAIADQIAQSSRTAYEFPTAMGHAIGYASTLLQRAPGCLFQTIDIAGDGESNDGFPPADAYAAFPLANVTINGLVVDGKEGVVQYYRDEVIQGPNSFIEIAEGFEDYQRAMERKLIRELSAMIIGQATNGERPPG